MSVPWLRPDRVAATVDDMSYPRRSGFVAALAPTEKLKGYTVRFGLTTDVFVSGDTVTVDPCTLLGVDIGEANHDVMISLDSQSVDLDKYDMNGDGAPQTTGCTLPAGTKVAYLVDSGTAIMAAIPRGRVVHIAFDDPNFVAKIEWDWGGWFQSTKSALWLQWQLGEVCP